MDDRLATIDLGRKVGAAKPFLWGNGCPSNSIAWAEAYLPAKWPIDHVTVWPQQRWADNWGEGAVPLLAQPNSRLTV